MQCELMNIIKQIKLAKLRRYDGSLSYYEACKLMANNICFVESLFIFYRNNPTAFHFMKEHYLINETSYFLITDALGPL